MKLIHLTDTHLLPPGTALGFGEPDLLLDTALADIAARHGDADLVVLTGDLVHDGGVPLYRALAEKLDRLGLPVALTIGNHDDRAAFAEVFPDAMDRDGHAQTVRRIGSDTCLILDTHEPGTHSGRLCPARLDWLEEALTRSVRDLAGRIWIFLHHNPIRTHLPMIDRIMLEPSERFQTLIAQHADRIAHIFHGHTHLPMTGALHGVPVTGSRGLVLAGYPNYGIEALLPHQDLPAAYSVIHADAVETTVMAVEFGIHLKG